MAALVDRDALGPLDAFAARSSEVPAVISVGYSMPPAPLAPHGGSTIVSVSYG